MGNLGEFILLFCLLVEINCVRLSEKAQSPTRAVGCKPVMDIAILADISRSMKTDHRGNLTEVVRELVDEIGVSETSHHFGFVTFAVNATLHINFSNPSYYNASNLKEKVSTEVDVVPDKDATRTDLAMNVSLFQLFSSDGGDRPNARNVLLIFTDGNPLFINDTWDDRPEIPLSNFTEKLKKKNVTFLVIGVGPKAEDHKEDMAKITGNDSQVITFRNFSQLRENFLKEFKKKMCDFLCPKDVAFILDSSGSVKNEDFDEEKEIVKTLMMELDIGPQKDRVALVLFGTKSKREARFGQYDASKFQDVLHKLHKMNDKTRIDRALNMAEDQIFPNSRQGAYKIAIILTDGVQSTGAQGLRQSSKPLRDAGVRMIAVRIGIGNRGRSLRLMTDRDEDVVDTKNIQGHLQEILKDLIQNDCNPQPPVARKPAECADEPGFERECRKKTKDKRFCSRNPDFCYMYCRKSCELCRL